MRQFSANNEHVSQTLILLVKFEDDELLLGAKIACLPPKITKNYHEALVVLIFPGRHDGANSQIMTFWRRNSL